MASGVSTHTGTAISIGPCVKGDEAALALADPRPNDLEIKRFCLLHRFQRQRRAVPAARTSSLA